MVHNLCIRNTCFPALLTLVNCFSFVHSLMLSKVWTTAFTIGRHPGSCKGQDLSGTVCLLSIRCKGFGGRLVVSCSSDFSFRHPSIPTFALDQWVAGAQHPWLCRVRSPAFGNKWVVSDAWNCEIAERFHMLGPRFNAAPVAVLWEGRGAACQGHFKMLSKSISREN